MSTYREVRGQLRIQRKEIFFFLNTKHFIEPGLRDSGHTLTVDIIKKSKLGSSKTSENTDWKSGL